jgi:O-antigen/teichoic acid export membrane protein
LLVSLNSNTPKYLLAYFQGDHELGIFCTLAAVMAAGTMAFRAVEQPSSPRLAIYFQHQRRAFWRLLKALIAIFTVVGVITVLLSVLFGRLLLSRLLAPEYGPYADVLALMMLATTTAHVAGILETSLIGARWTRVQLPMHGCTMLLCLALGYWLIPRTGAHGAAVALSVCRFPYIILAIILLRRIAPVGESATSRGHLVEPRLLAETSHYN